MKKHIKSLFVAAMALSVPAMVLTSCSEKDYYDVNINGIPEIANYEDAFAVTVDQSTNVATFTFNGKGVYPVWIIDGKSYSSVHMFTKYYRKAGDYTVECKVGNGNGVSKNAIVKTFHVDKTAMQGFGGYVYDSPYNLWPKAEKKDLSFYYAPGWSQIADPAVSFDGESFTVMLPEATTEKWQAQMHAGTNINLTQGQHYDGSVIFTTTMDMNGITLKIHPDGDDDDAHSFFMQQPINCKAGEPKCFYFSDLEAVVDMNNLVFTFDFGGNPAGIEINIENIVLKNHADDDGTVLPEPPVTPTDPEPAWVAWNSPDNLFYGCTFELGSYYANPDWSGRDGLTWEQTAEDTFFAGIPLAVAERWQCQCSINTNMTLEADVAYDFYCELESNVDIPKVMFKVVQTDEEGKKHDGNFLFADEQPLGAGTSTFWRANKTLAEGTPAHAVTVLFDFGTAPDATEVTIKNIILQKHHD